jgi:hypothetical protein
MSTEKEDRSPLSPKIPDVFLTKISIWIRLVFPAIVTFDNFTSKFTIFAAKFLCAILFV